MAEPARHILRSPTPGLVRLGGMLRPRRMLWAVRGDALTCWADHLVQDTGLPIIGCRHPACDGHLWLYRSRVPRGLTDRIWYADVSAEEARSFRELELSVDEVLRFFGAAI